MDDSVSDTQLQLNLKAAIWHSVDQIAQREARLLQKTVTPDFVASLADLVYKQIGTMAIDLEVFARHAKRSTITMEDVKLCARRNEGLHQLITEAAVEIARKSGRQSGRRRGRADEQ